MKRLALLILSILALAVLALGVSALLLPDGVSAQPSFEVGSGRYFAGIRQNMLIVQRWSDPNGDVALFMPVNIGRRIPSVTPWELLVDFNAAVTWRSGAGLLHASGGLGFLRQGTTVAGIHITRPLSARWLIWGISSYCLIGASSAFLLWRTMSYIRRERRRSRTGFAVVMHEASKDAPPV